MKKMNNAVFAELNTLAEKQITSGEETRKKYSDLLEAALTKRAALIDRKEEAELIGDIEAFQRIKAEIRKIESDIEDYEVGTHAMGSVKLSDKDIDSKLSTADAEIRKYLIEGSEEILKDLTPLLNKLNALIEAADSMKTAANKFTSAFRPAARNPYQPSTGFDAYLLREKERLENVCEEFRKGKKLLSK